MQPNDINPNTNPDMTPSNPNPQEVPQPFPASTPSPPTVPGQEVATPGSVVTPGTVIQGGFEPAAPAGPANGVNQVPPVQPAWQQPPLNPAAGQSGPVIGGVDPYAPISPQPGRGRRSLKPFLVALIAILVIGGGAAFAYVGIILPNKPINVLKESFINSLQQQQVSTDGTVQGGQASGSGIDYKVGFKTAADTNTKAADAQLNLSVSGITFPVEARLVNQNLYVKVGDLSTIANLLDTFLPGSGSMAQSFNSILANKWIVFDSTLLDESGTAKCLLNTSWSLSNSDLSLVESQYAKDPFVTIQSTSSDTVNGQAAEKFDINIDNSKFNSFGNGLRSLSVAKNLSKCSGALNISKSSSSSQGQTPLTVWVDKGTKRIVKVAAQTTAQEAKKSNLSGSVTVTLSYGNVSIKAPANATPALQALSQIENTPSGSSLLNMLGSGSSTTGSTP